MDPAIALDFESSKLLKLIKSKKEYLQKIDAESTQAKYLISEIEFLEKDILPVIMNRNFYVNDIVLPLELGITEIAQLQPLLRSKIAGILYYHQFRIPDKETDQIAMLSNIDFSQYTTNLSVWIDKEVMIENYGKQQTKDLQEISLFPINYGRK